ncbi:MAG: hypothetical protein K2J14_03370 [Treponemataceae bacterium]|nr:hypothetical protein [Treponemataceae bacterium]
MDDKITAAFDAVRASETLKTRTKAYIARKTNGFAAQKKPHRRRIMLAAAVFPAMILFAGAGLFLTPTTRISIDINPSLELGINRFDNVVSVRALNDDGKKLAESLDITFTPYDKALRTILNNKNIESLLRGNEVMTITVADTNSAQSSRLLSRSQTCAASHGNVYCHSANAENVSEAHKLGLSFGKYRAFLELRALNPAIAPEDIQGMTMREIRELLSALQAEHGTGGQPPAPGGGHHGNGHGHGRR